jgi:hypothetical protein
MADDNRLRFPLAGASYARATPQPSYARPASEPDDGSDPLEELARLIGHDDVFGQKRHEPAPPSPRRMSAAPAREQAFQDYQAPDGYEETDYAARIYGYQPQRSTTYADEAAPVPQAEAYYDDHADPHAAAAFDEAAYQDDYGYDEAPPLAPKRRGGLFVVGAVLGLAVIGTAGAVGYRHMKGGTVTGQPPIITADKTPTKIPAPAPSAEGQTGTIRSLHNDMPQDSKVLVREEQPMEMREAKAPSPRVLPYAAGSAPMNVPTGPGASALANPNEPRKVHTLTIRPDGSIVQERPHARGSSARDVDVPPPPARPSASGAVKTASVQPTEIPPTAQTRIAPGSHVVQLTSQRTEAEAQASFRTLQAKYPNILGGRQPLIRKVDLGQRGTYYRAQIGPFASLDQATDLCGHLKAAGGQCIVQKN